jgi:hypothetical protein
VINDEEAKAKELFHDIVVEKSREIYENLMNEEDEEDLDEAEEEDLDEGMGGDASDSLINDVEAEEEGMQEDEESDAEFDDEAEEDGEDLTHDMEMDHDQDGDIEDRVIDLEDKLDELMAEFEAIMGGEDDGIDSDLAGEEGDELAGDALAQDDTMAFDDNDMDENSMGMMENVTLDKVPAPKHGDDGANNKSPVAFNSGAKGMAASPVKMTGDTAQGRPAPKTADLPEAGTFKNVPGKGGSNSKLSAAPKPTLTQAAGTNTRTPFPKG